MKRSHLLSLSTLLSWSMKQTLIPSWISRCSMQTTPSDCMLTFHHQLRTVFVGDDGYTLVSDDYGTSIQQELIPSDQGSITTQDVEWGNNVFLQQEFVAVMECIQEPVRSFNTLRMALTGPTQTFQTRVAQRIVHLDCLTLCACEGMVPHCPPPQMEVSSPIIRPCMPLSF